MTLRTLRTVSSMAVFAISIANASAQVETPTKPVDSTSSAIIESVATNGEPNTTTSGIEPPALITSSPSIVPQKDLLADAATVYGSFHSDVGIYRRTFTSADDIAEAAEVLGTHNPEALASGWLAYSALLASESPRYATEVRNTAAHYGRDRLLMGLGNDVGYSLTFRGADDALQRALDAGKADARRLNQIGSGITYQARGPLQSLGWAKAKLRGDSDKFASELENKSLSGRPKSAAVLSVFKPNQLNTSLRQASGLGSSTSLWDRMPGLRSTSVLNQPTSAGAFQTSQPQFRRNPNLKFLHGRITTLAAYRILNATTEPSAGLSNSLSDKTIVTNLSMDNCVKTAQLQYRGCVVGNHFVFERAYCIGEHGVSDIGKCISQVTR